MQRARSSGTRYPSRIKHKAKRLYVEKEYSLSDICVLDDMPNNLKVIRGWLVDQGVKIRPKQPIFPREEILAKLNSDIPRSEIQEEYGCSMKYLSNLVNGTMTKPAEKTKISKKRTKVKLKKKRTKTKTIKKKRTKIKAIKKKLTKTQQQKKTAAKKRVKRGSKVTKAKKRGKKR